MKTWYIDNVHERTWGIRVGECLGRIVRWNYATWLWYFEDTGDSLFGRYKYSYGSRR